MNIHRVGARQGLGKQGHGRLIAALRALRRGGIVAYPTEAVYGLGCDPFDAEAVHRLCEIKQRPAGQGLLLIAETIDQVRPLIEAIDDERWSAILATWPGPITWIFPASREAPDWLCARDRSLAVRVTAHPVARALCRGFAGPIVSTSANLRGRRPARTALEVRKRLGDNIQAIVSGPVGGNERPSRICRAIDGVCLRD